MKRIVHVGVILLLLSIVAGNAQAKSLKDLLNNYDPAEYSIIYGQIDTSNCDYHLNRVYLLKYPPEREPKPASNKNQAEYIVIDHDFFWAVVKPGDYFLYQFRTAQRGLFGSQLFTTFDNAAVVKSEEPGQLVHWGNVEFIRTKNPGFFTLGHFE